MKGLLLTTVVFTASILSVSAQTTETAAKSPEKLVKWYTLEEAIQLSKKEPRKIFMDVYTDWCGWCKKMDAVTFENPIVAAYLNAKFYPVKFDAEVTDTILFKDKKYVYVAQEGQRGYNELASELMNGRMSYPTVIFLDEQLNNMQAIPGFRAAPDMDRILKFFGDNYYRMGDYDTFLSTYVSPFTEHTNKPATTGQ